MMKSSLLLSLSLFISCGNFEPSSQEDDIQHDLIMMDLGKSLYKDKCERAKTYDEADSAYNADAENVIRGIYEEVEAEQEKRNECEKPCCHIFFNKYCRDCKEYRFKH